VADESTRVVIAHLADPHLDGSPAVEARFAAVIGHLAARREHIDMVILAGDIIETSDIAHPTKALDAVRQQVADVAPSVLSPGNSDDSSAFDPGPRFVARHRNLHVISLDSSVPGEMGGRLETDDVSWVAQVLGGIGAGEFAILVMHHPPVTFGHPVVDGWRAHGATAELERLIAATPAVLATLVGHTHGAAWTTFGGPGSW
jgi:3',5'-cyclic-AMP phosphodiesterase